MGHGYTKLPVNARIVQGQVVYQGRFGRRYGIVYGVRPGPGAGDHWRDDGEAEFDIVWDNGDQYHGLAEAALRHGNIDILDDVADADQILDALAHAKHVAARRELAEREETDRLLAYITAYDQRRSRLLRENAEDDKCLDEFYDDEDVV